MEHMDDSRHLADPVRELELGAVRGLAAVEDSEVLLTLGRGR